MAYKDNRTKRKTPFEIVTMILVVIMLLVTVGALVLSAISAVL